MVCVTYEQAGSSFPSFSPGAGLSSGLPVRREEGGVQRQHQSVTGRFQTPICSAPCQTPVSHQRYLTHFLSVSAKRTLDFGPRLAEARDEHGAPAKLGETTTALLLPAAKPP